MSPFDRGIIAILLNGEKNRFAMTDETWDKQYWVTLEYAFYKITERGKETFGKRKHGGKHKHLAADFLQDAYSCANFLLVTA